MDNNKFSFINNHVALLLITLCFSSISCTKKFNDYNTDPNNASEKYLSYDNLGVGTFIAGMETSIFLTQLPSGQVNGQYQLVYNLAADIYSGHQASCDGFYNSVNNGSYAMIPSWYNVAFAGAYQNFMAPWYQLKTQTQVLNLPVIYALAQILKVEGMHRIVDQYGPMPYLNFTPAGSTPYNAQKDIYTSFFSELDSAISVLTVFVQQNPDARPLSASFDPIYEGDFAGWLKFANTLKLRLAMRTVYTNASFNGKTSQQLAEEAVTAGVMTDNSDNAILPTDNVNTMNPLYLMTYPYDDTRMSASMESFLKGYNDPRLPLLFGKVSLPADSSPDYHGVRAGSTISGRAYDVFSPLNVAATTPVQIMVAAEAYFLKAEGALRGWNMGGTPQSLYETGITTAFGQAIGGSQQKPSGAAGYIADDTSAPVDYNDPVNSSNNISAATAIPIKWVDNTGFNETNLEQIITQKWISLYPDGQEAWSEFRRTGYPKIFPVANNYSNGLIDNTIQIRRIPFPTTEYQNNAGGVAIGVKLLQSEAIGGSKDDNGGTRLWWDQNPNH